MPDDDPPIYIGMPVDELPRPHVPSTTRSCEGCGAVVWVDRRTVRLAATARSILCTNCALLLVEEADGQLRH